MKVAFTHKGWFGLCPVYMADLHTISPRLEPRLPLTSWLIHLSAEIFNLMNADGFPLRIAGELNPSKVIEVSD